jgi:hypothetical protein
MFLFEWWLRKDLARFPSADLARQALIASRRRAQLQWLGIWFLGICLGMAPWILLVAMSNIRLFTGFLPNESVRRWLFVTCGLLFAAAGGQLLLWLTRHKWRRRLWRYMNSIGMRTCNSCGYDMSGTSSARCPECGAIAPEVPQHHYEEVKKPAVPQVEITGLLGGLMLMIGSLLLYNDSRSIPGSVIIAGGFALSFWRLLARKKG